MMGAKAEPEPNYIVPSDSAGLGESVATFTEGNLLHITKLAKGAGNDIRGYFKRTISIKAGDAVRLKVTRKSGSFNSGISVKFYIGSLVMNNDTAIAWTTSTNVDMTSTATTNISATYFRVYNISNARTGSNDSHLVEIFINGEQVI